MQYVTVSLKTDTPMVFGGTEEPTAYGELLSIGAIGGDKNKKISKLVADILTSKFGVPSDRFYLTVSTQPDRSSLTNKKLISLISPSNELRMRLSLCGAVP